MATPRTTEQDPHDLGRHNARFVGHGTHLWAVLNSLRRATGDVSASAADVSMAAEEWDLPEEAIRAAIRYYELHRDLYDAYFLLQDEEWNAWNSS